MIHIKDLTVKNFMSVGNATQAIGFDRRDIYSTEWTRHIPNIVIVNDWFQEGDVVMAPGDVKFESVDQIVIDQITKIESEFYYLKLLLQIYQAL